MNIMFLLTRLMESAILVMQVARLGLGALDHLLALHASVNYVKLAQGSAFLIAQVAQMFILLHFVTFHRIV
jgi:hypothetical protein